VKRVLILPRYDRLGASSRYRTFQFLPALRSAGIQTAVAPLLSNAHLLRAYRIGPGGSPSRETMLRAGARRLAAVFSAFRYDAVILEKELMPRIPLHLETLLLLQRVPYIADYDDAVYVAYKDGLDDAHSRIGTIVRKATKVFAGNHHLASVFRRLNENTEYMPTVIDMRSYPVVKKHANQSTAVIGWIGTPITAPYLQHARAALSLLARRGVSFRLDVIGAEPVGLSDVPARSVEWSEATEASSLLDVDIGIMPLPDTEWTRGKCGLKLLQYMACGLPVVASPVGANRDIVLDEETGFLPHDAEEWADSLARLIASRDLRERLGGQGRERVAELYSLQRWADTYVRHVLDVV
jgi:glycosyltransferase involved in cell wall biosynthesis